MGRRGPAPKPTTLKLIEGNKGKRPINHREPKPPRLLPKCPDHLDKEAKREWRKISIELFKIGLLTMIDRAALAAYCQSYSTWVSAQEKTNHFGQYVSGSKKNTLVIAPWVRLANESLVQMKMFLCEFGLTPSSRTRLEVKSQEEKSLEELLA